MKREVVNLLGGETFLKKTKMELFIFSQYGKTYVLSLAFGVIPGIRDYAL